jgi:uncharacterized membrane protein
MEKNRLEAFSDGVLAIVITLMALELKVPHGADWQALKPLVPVFLAYVLSFVYVGIYWNNHHHLIKATRSVTGGIMWANLHLLFWLSLFPFTTAWMGENEFQSLPSAVYGTVLLCAAIAYVILQQLIVRHEGGSNSTLAKAIGKDWKGKLSAITYLIGIFVSFVRPGIAGLLYAIVALTWLIPDRRIERVVEHH